MTDNVVNFPAGSGETAEPERGEIIRKRLIGADEIEKELRRPHNLKKADRSVFARNLGRMWERAFSGQDRHPVSELFDTAFGQRSGASNYKKRKRFIRFHGEALPERAAEIGEGEFAAKGYLFADLARAIAKMANTGRGDDVIEQEGRRAILQLIEGSSFDKRLAPYDRYRAEALTELNKRVQQMVDMVEREVDLDWIQQTLLRDTVSAEIDQYGTVRSLIAPVNSEWGFDFGAMEKRSDKARELLAPLVDFAEDPSEIVENLNPCQRDAFKAYSLLLSRCHAPNCDPVILPGYELDLRDTAKIGNALQAQATETWSNFSPRVVLGFVHSIIEPENGFVRVKVDPQEVDEKIEPLKKVCEQRLSELSPSEFQQWAGEDKLRRGVICDMAAREFAKKFGVSDEMIEESSPYILSNLNELFEDEACRELQDPWQDDGSIKVVVRKRLELQLRRDPVSDTWQPVLALVQGVGVDSQPREGVVGLMKKEGFLPVTYRYEPAYNLGSQEHDIVGCDMAQLFLVRVSDDEYAFFAVDSPEVSAGEYFLGMGSGCLPLRSDAGAEAMLAELELELGDHYVFLPFGKFPYKPCPAEAQSIAGIILRNLAYAADQERYDKLLLADAKLKEQLLRDFAAKRRAEYDKAVSRMD